VVTIYKDVRRIDFCTTLNNEVEDHRLRVLFNAPFGCSEVLVETTFGVVQRPSKVEAGEDYFEKPIGTSPQKTFSCVEDDASGMALFNRGIPEVEAIPGENSTALALTLLRSVGWLSREDLTSRTGPAGPLIETPGAQAKGCHMFEYAFTTYQGGYADADIVGQAHSFAFPPIAIMTNRHKGKIKDGSSLVRIDNPNVMVSALEPYKTEGGYCVRIYNSTEDPQTARLTPVEKGLQMREINFMMKRLTKVPVGRKRGVADLSFRPYEIKTLELVPTR
jgi:mannosylglycerate hydrolase